MFGILELRGCIAEDVAHAVLGTESKADLCRYQTYVNAYELSEAIKTVPYVYPSRSGKFFL